MDQLNIVEYDEFRAQLTDIKNQCNFIPDVSTDEGYQKSRRISLDIGKILSKLEKTRKDKKAYFLEGGRQVDSQAKAIAEELKESQEPHKLAYQEVDNMIKKREQERKEKLESRLAFLYEIPEHMQDSSSEEVKKAIEDLKADECEDYQEYTNRALEARNSSLKKLTELFERKLKQELQEEELRRLREQQEAQRKKDEEERIRKEAAAKAEAEKQAAIERELKAKQDAIEAERQKVEAEKRLIEQKKAAQEAAEKAKKLAEQREKEAAERAKQEEIKRQEAKKRLEEEERQRREENKRHVASVNRKAVKSLMENGMIEGDAKLVINLIAKGKVPGVSINY